jgi:Domain of unknown function (DUF3825)
VAFIKAFVKESDRQLTGFGKRPDMASYFDDPRQLLYDVAVELVVDIDHIIGAPERVGTAIAFRRSLGPASSRCGPLWCRRSPESAVLILAKENLVIIRAEGAAGLTV